MQPGGAKPWALRALLATQKRRAGSSRSVVVCLSTSIHVSRVCTYRAWTSRGRRRRQSRIVTRMVNETREEGCPPSYCEGG